MSCGQIALNRANIKYNTYYASEIDKYAIKVTQANYPNTVQLGDITKWRDWNIDWSSIGLVTAGFPCQAWSIAGKQLGDRDERGMLFWVMLDIISHVKKYNPKVRFIIENVKMKSEFEQYVTEHTEKALGSVYKYLINSALVSAQNRQRYYWTNIAGVSQPEDKKVFLFNIIEEGVVDRDKSYCIDANYWKGTNVDQYIKKGRGQIAFTERRSEEAKRIRKEYRQLYGRDFSPRRLKVLEARDDGKMNCLTATFSTKEHTLIDEKLYYRKLTPLEYERLQTVPDNYTNHVSNTQRYRMLGNGWTVDVIVHILKHIV
jgi:DNA (cytosine-5)-methyltransferase 1/DNA (cytosine-5)-methyltransferase 3A